MITIAKAGCADTGKALQHVNLLRVTLDLPAGYRVGRIGGGMSCFQKDSVSTDDFFVSRKDLEIRVADAFARALVITSVVQQADEKTPYVSIQLKSIESKTCSKDGRLFTNGRYENISGISKFRYDWVSLVNSDRMIHAVEDIEVDTREYGAPTLSAIADRSLDILVSRIIDSMKPHPPLR